MKVYGWTPEQWARAAAVVGSDKPAKEVRQEYIKRYGTEPGGVSLIGVKPKEDWKGAEKLLSTAAPFAIEHD